MAGGNLEGQEITIDWKVVRKEGRDLSFYVRDSSGFDLEWDYDPTIEGALRTLDLVHSYLKDSGDEECREILNNLISPIKKAVAFRFMPMERYGLTDDLYIKMNARGLPLTVGERFKSSLEKVLSQAHEESCENIWNEFLDEKPMKGSVVKQDNITNVPPAKRFGLLYDNEWADYFWSVQKGSPVCSEAIEFSVLSRLFALSYILGSTSDIKSILKDNVLATLLRISGKETFVSFPNVFQKVLVLDGNACGTVVVKNVADRMNAIVAYSDRMSNNLSPGWSKQRYDSFPKLISAIAVSAERDYYQRVAVFYSIVLFLEIDKRCDEGLLAEWMRVCWNVIENAPVNDLESLISFTKTIHKCALEYDSFKQNGGGQNSIIDFVATKDFSTGFAAATFLQERMKARMIVSANDRCEAYDLVRKIESGHFFHGDISFQLYKTNSVDEMLERDDWLKSFIDKNGEGDKIDDCRYACFMCGLVTHVRSFSSLRTLFQRNNFNPSEANVHRWLALDKTGGGVGVEAMFGFYCSDKKIMSSAGFYGSECDEMEKVLFERTQKLLSDEVVWSWEGIRNKCIQWSAGAWCIHKPYDRGFYYLLNSPLYDVLSFLENDRRIVVDTEYKKYGRYNGWPVTFRDVEGNYFAINQTEVYMVDAAKRRTSKAFKWFDGHDSCDLEDIKNMAKVVAEKLIQAKMSPVHEEAK